MSAIKVWADDEDFVLSQLCGMMMRRNLYHVDITSEPPDQHLLRKLIDKASAKYPIMKDEAGYFVFTDTITNNAYKPGDGSIRILMKDGTLHDIASASDNSNLEALAKTVKKYVFCYTKDLI
jgi:hypothetical protein